MIILKIKFKCIFYSKEILIYFSGLGNSAGFTANYHHRLEVIRFPCMGLVSPSCQERCRLETQKVDASFPCKNSTIHSHMG